MILKKQLNDLYFEVNKNESRDKMFKVSPDDFVFPEKAEILKQEARQKFLEKYLKMKKKKKEEFIRLKKLKQLNIKEMSYENDLINGLNTSFPDIIQNSVMDNGVFDTIKK